MSDEVKPWNLFDGSPRSSEEVSSLRLATCYLCPSFKPVTKRCDECGCFMSLKVKLEEAFCPLGKW